jgi:hypothetical protein
MSTPPVYPGVYLIKGWGTLRDTYARFNGGFWEYGGASTPELAVFSDSGPSMALSPVSAKYHVYRWYGVDEATSKGQA